jgi:hypothetical protein
VVDRFEITVWKRVTPEDQLPLAPLEKLAGTLLFLDDHQQFTVRVHGQHRLQACLAG